MRFIPFYCFAGLPAGAVEDIKQFFSHGMKVE